MGRQLIQVPRQRLGRAGAGRLGHDTDGKPVFVGLEAASSESGEGFLTGLGERGLRTPLLVVSDGEHSCLSLVWAVLDRASAGWLGLS